MSDDPRARLVGINHVALEVGDVDAALDFYGKIFRFTLRGSHEDESGKLAMAFIDMGDQFLALSRGRRQGLGEQRHFGLVVDDRRDVLELAKAAGAKVLDGRFQDFLDPWGNRIEIVQYRDIQFVKSAPVLEKLSVDGTKSDQAQQELCDKGID